MKATVLNGIDILSEAVSLLEYLATAEVMAERKVKIIKNSEVSPEKLEKLFRALGKIIASAKKKLKKDMDLVKHYFTPLGSENHENNCLSLGYFAVLMNLTAYQETIASRRKHCFSLSEEERSQEFGELIILSLALVGEPQLDKKVCSCKELKDVLLLLDETDFSFQQKWQVQWVFTHCEQAFEETARLLEKALEALAETRAYWEPLQQEFYRIWEERLKQVDFADYIKELIQLKIEESGYDVIILPNMLAMNRFTYSLNTLKPGMSQKKPDVCRIGIILEQTGLFTEATGSEAQKKRAATLLKLLSDDSKLEILTLLKERKYYGSELAKRLELTTATISHHMNALTGNGLVTINKEANRIYYSLNEKNVRRLLDYTKELLLKEER